ncbi:MAG: type II toxin-antitoxin system RelE family toxin [Brasilonema sp.]
MNEYQVVFSRSSQKELEALPTEVISRIFPKIESLAVEPRPDGCKKLKGQSHCWRIRVGDYRVIYSVDDNTRIVEIIMVCRRSQAYK